MHVISGLEIGGAENMLVHLVRELENRGIPQYVVNLRSGGAHEAVMRHLIGDRYTACNIHGPASAFPGFLRLRRAISKAKPLCLQGWMYHGDLFATLGHLSLFSPRRTRLYWGVRCSNMDFSRYSFQLKATVHLCRLLSHLPTRIISNSSAGITRHMEFGYVSDRFALVQNCVTAKQFSGDQDARATVRAGLNIPEDAFVFCIIARTDPMKGYDVFLDVARQMPKAIALAAGLGTDKLAGPPNYLGLGVRRDVPDILKAVDVLVSTSRFGEGQSNSILEAMATGLPVVATDTGDSANLIRQGGIVVEPDDTMGIVDALSHLADRPADRASFGRANRLRIERDYSPATMADAFLDVYGQESAV